LDNAEKVLAETAEQDRLEGCICKEQTANTVVLSWEPGKFEAEMNQKCRVHGFRYLGELLVFNAVGRGGVLSDKSRIDALLEEYCARKSQYTAKLEHDQQ